MDTTTTSAAHTSSRASRARRRASEPRASRPRPASAPAARKRVGEPPPLSVDVEFLEDLRDMGARKLRAVVRERPLSSLGGAFAAGFLVGGGWRTRLGRLMLVAANRYFIFQAARHHFGA